MPKPPYASTVSLARRMERRHGYHLAPEDYASERSLWRAMSLFEAPAGFAGHELTQLDAARRVPSRVPFRADPDES